MTSSKDREKWVVPGGGMEPTEESHTTAEREALEEAGVRGTLGRYLGMFEVRPLYDMCQGSLGSGQISGHV